MKSILNWIFKNAWNLFGVLGVIGTFYFSLAYVPDYVKEITTGKINVIHESLMDDIRELVFYEKAISIKDIESFIRGKELKQGVTYPYTPEELLIQVQERFMGNKFIPLQKRELLLKNINEIRLTYTPPKTPVKKPFDWVSLLSVLLSSLGVAVAAAGASSIIRKLKFDKETEVDIVSGNVTNDQYHSTIPAAYYHYEQMVGSILTELGVLISSQEDLARDIGYDFLAGNRKLQSIIEVKMYTRLLGLGSAREFLHKVIESGKCGILIVSSGVTQRTKELIERHNKATDNQKVHLVIGDTKELIKKQLAEIFSS